MQPALQVCNKVLGFQRLRRTTKKGRFYHLDWTDVPKDIIKALFPIQEGRYGSLDHPPAYLKFTALVERWRMIGGNEQKNVINRLEEEEEIVRMAQATSSARERRSNQPKQVRRQFSDSALVIQVGDDDESGNGFGLTIDISDNPPPLDFLATRSAIKANIRHLKTGFVSPQYPIVFDDLFESVFSSGPNDAVVDSPTLLTKLDN
jgi:hypothetical protein